MTNHPLVLGYYADWATNLSPKAIDYRLFTHLNHAFATVGKSGDITLPNPAKSRDLCERGHSAGVKVLISVGGADSGPAFSQITSSPAGVGHAADLIALAVRRAGYDGVDVDWEFPSSAPERDQMNALMRALRERMPKAILSMATPATNWNGKWFERDPLLPYLDYVNVMTYDFHGSWSDHAGYNAPLFFSPADGHAECRGNTIDGSTDYWLRQKSWPRDKFILGIPLYGHGFRVARWGAAASGTYPRSDVNWNDIEPLKDQGWQREWDSASQVPFLLHPKHEEIVSYDDKQSIELKGQYARKHGLGGIFFWEISLDYNGVTNPLIRAARAGLL